jgi:hypothetical protein
MVEMAPEKPQKIWNACALQFHFVRKMLTLRTQCQHCIKVTTTGLNQMDTNSDFITLPVTTAASEMVATQDAHSQS